MAELASNKIHILSKSVDLREHITAVRNVNAFTIWAVESKHRGTKEYFCEFYTLANGDNRELIATGHISDADRGQWKRIMKALAVSLQGTEQRRSPSN
jgi:hypothetical protein